MSIPQLLKSSLTKISFLPKNLFQRIEIHLKSNISSIPNLNIHHFFLTLQPKRDSTMNTNKVKGFFYPGSAVSGEPDYRIAEYFVRSAKPLPILLTGVSIS